VTHL